MTEDEIKAIIRKCGLVMVKNQGIGGGGISYYEIHIRRPGRKQRKIYLGTLSVLSRLNEEQLRARIKEKAGRLPGKDSSC